MASVGTDAEGQIKFLVNCIKHSQGGKIDFQAVADDCNIVSKAAAAKRFERLLKAHGMKASELSKGSTMNGTSSPAQNTASPKTPAKSTSKTTPKSKGKRAAPTSSTKDTKRAKMADHPAVSSYNVEDDEEDEAQFKVKEETQAPGDAVTNNGSYHDHPRDRDFDDDELQLLYIVEKPTGCPVHDFGESRSSHSTSMSSDTNTESSMQMMARAMSLSRLNGAQVPTCYHGWSFMPETPVYAWPDTCTLHGEREAAQLVGIC
ncbi:uncharacterized protein ColSpa_07164 [Colletotrichum spaethianum]|uniref:Myb-like DNA-binding domain-containing protein n=1 Tax=Colletotrichum spaethianum TaxID=700344 RepID=A0AA37LI62_9PEZI|nr:uncharacterized protein ColSpa_07164 [Colletotrichum spaethianum]GKT46983.1 hypothetical protein ColSpa_07164 [Colletotrichum spaethianum]